MQMENDLTSHPISQELTELRHVVHKQLCSLRYNTPNNITMCMEAANPVTYAVPSSLGLSTDKLKHLYLYHYGQPHQPADCLLV